MHGYRAILEKEVIEAWRTYRVVLVSALFVSIGIAAPVIARYLPELVQLFGEVDAEIGVPEASLADVLDLLVAGLAQAGVLAAVFLTMGAVAGERERGTAWLMLTRPVSRAAYVWAKVVALAMIMGLATSLAVLAAWLYTTLLFGPQDPLGWIQLAVVAWLATMVYVSITFLGSVVAGSTVGAAGVGVAAAVGLAVGSTVTTLGPWLPTGLFDVAKAAVLQEASEDLDPSRTVVVSVGIIAVAAVLSWARFRREEI
jgi:ABC-2 type transport system permease protein